MATVLQKVPLSKVSDDVIACDFWFPLRTKNPRYAYAVVIVFLSKVDFGIYFNS